MCFLRDRPVPEAMATLRDAQRYFLSGDIHGIGLDSDEIGYPPSMFAGVYAAARAMGITMICGHGGHDGAPTPYVSELMDVLHVSRIDHGVRIVEDPAMVARASGTPFTVCPVSNVKIGPYATMSDHPIRAMYNAGLCVSVNSDDPAYLGASLTENFSQVCEAFGWGEKEVRDVLRNAVGMSFMDPERKATVQGLMDAF